MEESESDHESVDENSNATTIIPGLDVHSSASTNDPCSTTVANHAIEKLVIENNIFLKAALQLLDQRDHSIEANSKLCQDGSSADVIMCGA